MNKTLKVMTSAALLAGVVAPVAVTTVDAANTKNIVDKVLYVDDDYETKSGNNENNLIIRASDIDFDEKTVGDSFRLSLPSGAKWLKGEYDGGVITNADDTEVLEVISVSDRDLELEILDVSDGEFEIPLYFEIDGAEGEVDVTVDPRGSVLTGGSYTIAIVNEGSTSVSIDSVSTIRDNGTIKDIRLDENSIGSLYEEKYDTESDNYSGPQEITLTLPSDFDWADKAKIERSPLDYIDPAGGFKGYIDTTKVKAVVDDNELTFEFAFKGKPEKIGTFYIKGLKIDADKKAEYGEIEVDLDGDEVTSGTIVVAKYGDFGTSASLKGDVPTLLAGRLTDDEDDVETVEVLLKETVAGSWLPGRSVDIEFPSWVKVLGVDVSDSKNPKADSTIAGWFNDDIDGDSNEISFDLPSDLADTGKKEFKVKFYVSTKADVEGDVTVKISGRAGIEVDETTIAKVVAPVKVDVEKVEVRTGIQKQALNDIIITEAVKGALLEDGEVTLSLPRGVDFTDNEPTITVEEGNIKIKKDTIDVDDEVLKFEIDGESTRASKIKISGLELDLNRSIPEGDVTVEVGGTAVIQNWAENGNVIDDKGPSKFGDKQVSTLKDINSNVKVGPGEFDRDYVVKPVIALVTTPAEGNATVEEAVFTVGSTAYKVGDKEFTMDVAPFIEAGRTYLPVKYAAQAVGVDADNIFWDQATQTATIIKGNNVAEFKLGTNVVKLNGGTIGMPDAKVQLKDNRVVLPIKYVGAALGAQPTFNEADQTITVK